jgi:ferredoxin
MLFVALALAQAAPFDTKADYIGLTKQFCAKDWPDNFEMQAYCLKQQAQGMLQFKAVSDELGKPIEKALEHCTEEWTTDRLPNFAMIGYCATKQAESYRSLRQP